MICRSEAGMSAETISRAKGISGNTIVDLREVASVWDNSALICVEHGEAELASRDRRFAAAMREAADILEKKADGSAHR